MLYKWANNWTSINVFYFPDQLFSINTIENNGVSGNKALTEIVLFSQHTKLLKDQILSFCYSYQSQSVVEHIEVHSGIPTSLYLISEILFPCSSRFLNNVTFWWNMSSQDKMIAKYGSLQVPQKIKAFTGLLWSTGYFPTDTLTPLWWLQSCNKYFHW